jgi:hypothetical protein
LTVWFFGYNVRSRTEKGEQRFLASLIEVLRSRAGRGWESEEDVGWVGVTKIIVGARTMLPTGMRRRSGGMRGSRQQ